MVAPGPRARTGLQNCTPPSLGRGTGRSAGRTRGRAAGGDGILGLDSVGEIVIGSNGTVSTVGVGRGLNLSPGTN